MYRTHVHGAIPERPYPKLDNVALGIEEFGAKPGLKGKRAQDITDLSLVKELEVRDFSRVQIGSLPPVRRRPAEVAQP